MHASTAFSVGIGIVAIALAAGLSGGLLIANGGNPPPPKQAMVAAAPERQAPPPQPMPASDEVRYVGATLAFADPSVDAAADSRGQQVDKSNAAPAAAPAKASNDEAAKPVDAPAPDPSAQVPQQPAAGNQPSAPDDAFAKARDTDLKRPAERRHAARAQRWAYRHRGEQDQNSFDQQPRNDRNDSGWTYSDNYSARRYWNEGDRSYRDAQRWYQNDRRSHYYADQPPRSGWFGPN